MQASAPQSYRRYPLTHALATAGQVRVLRALSLQDGPLAAAQVARDAGLPRRGARVGLGGLGGRGLGQVLGQPRAQVYDLDRSHPLGAALRTLFEHERDAWEAARSGLGSALAQRRDVRAAWMYGSVARAEDTPRSDIDLAVLVEPETPGGAAEVREAMQGIAKRLGLPLSTVVLTTEELAGLPADDAWFGEVVRDALVVKGRTPRVERDLCAQSRRDPG